MTVLVLLIALVGLLGNYWLVAIVGLCLLVACFRAQEMEALIPMCGLALLLVCFGASELVSHWHQVPNVAKFLMR